MDHPDRRRVVVINDTPAQLDFFHSILTDTGYTVENLPKAEYALAAIRPDNPPGLIIVDLHSADINGWSFCRLCRSADYPHLNAVPILVTSATFGGTDVRQVTLASGANAFLELEFRASDLLHITRELLEGRHPNHRPCVLVAEHDVLFARHLAAALESAGFLASVVGDAESARHTFLTERPELVLLSHTLPNTGGLALLEEFSTRSPHVACILMIEQEARITARDAVHCGASAFIRKPFPVGSLVDLAWQTERERAILLTESVFQERTRKLLREDAQRLKEEERLSEELERQRRRYADLFSHMQIAVFLLDPDRNIVWANSFAERHFPEKGSETCCCHRNAEICSLENVGCPVRACFDTGDVQCGNSRNANTGRSYQTTAYPVRNDDGSVVQVIATVVDVTDRVNAEEQLRKSEAKYRLIMERSPDVIWTMNRDLDFTYVSPSITHVFGYSVEEALSKRLYEIMPPESVQVLMELFASASAAGIQRLPTIEVQQFNTDGEPFWTAVTITVDVDENHQIQYVQGLTQDITARKHAEEEKTKLQEQLQQALKMEAVGRLAGGVAHDFNNLLTAITCNVQLASMDLSTNDPLSETLTEIGRAADSAAELTRQLLAFSRKQIIEPRIVNLNDLVATMHKMLVRLIGEDVDLKMVPGKRLGSVKVDPGQFERILVNLVVNARDAMPDGGEITIHTENVELDIGQCRVLEGIKAGAYVSLTVKDTGHGISDDVLPHIFEPFFTTKEVVGKGTGLGLATIYGAVKQAGGAVHVASEVNVGTTFTIYLPRVEEKPERLTRERRALELSGGTETVLVVEDERSVLDLVIRALKRLGYTVLHASDGGQAFMQAESYQGPIHLLLTDVVMPGVNGRQLAERLARIHPDMRVLFTSGYTEDIIAHHGIVDEGLHFIAKPYSLQGLAKKIRAVLDEKRP